MEPGISFRWGIPSLDDSGGVYIYGFMLRNWAKLGINRNEFVFICHLAARHYESGQGQASPSLATISEQMGYADEQGAGRISRSLEKKGLLSVEKREGKTSIYNLHGFAEKCLKLENGEPLSNLIGVSKMTVVPLSNLIDEEKEDKNNKLKNIGSTSQPPENSQPDKNQKKLKDSQDASALKEEKKSDESGGAAGLDGYMKASSKHPAIQAWRQVTNRYPVKGIWGLVAHRLGNQPDVNVLARVCTQWAAKGFNVMNVAGQLDWYCEAMQSYDPMQWEKEYSNGHKPGGATSLVAKINKAIEEKGYTWKPDFQEPEIQALLKKYEWADICKYWDDDEIAERLNEFKPQSAIGRILNGQGSTTEH